MPLTANGKIDSKALIALLDDHPSQREGAKAPSVETRPLSARKDAAATNAGAADLDALEAKVTGWWSDALGGRHLAAHDSFFDAGGTSLELVRVHRLMEQELGTEIPIVDLFRLTTPHETANYLANFQAQSDASGPFVQGGAETAPNAGSDEPAKAGRSRHRAKDA